MIKSWANGTEHRRVFVLEQAAEFLRSHGVGVGDAVGICTDENGARACGGCGPLPLHSAAPEFAAAGGCCVCQLLPLVQTAEELARRLLARVGC